jgi:RNA recognition motif-containing protein
MDRTSVPCLPGLTPVPLVRDSIALGPDGRSKGFGNVLFQNEEDAAIAVQSFDGYVWFAR